AAEVRRTGTTHRDSRRDTDASSMQSASEFAYAYGRIPQLTMDEGCADGDHQGMRPVPSATVTFVFTDVEGSTRLLHELGAERYAEALGEHRRVLRTVFAA